MTTLAEKLKDLFNMSQRNAQAQVTAQSTTSSTVASSPYRNTYSSGVNTITGGTLSTAAGNYSTLSSYSMPSFTVSGNSTDYVHIGTASMSLKTALDLLSSNIISTEELRNAIGVAKASGVNFKMLDYLTVLVDLKVLTADEAREELGLDAWSQDEEIDE